MANFSSPAIPDGSQRSESVDDRADEADSDLITPSAQGDSDAISDDLPFDEDTDNDDEDDEDDILTPDDLSNIDSFDPRFPDLFYRLCIHKLNTCLRSFIDQEYEYAGDDFHSLTGWLDRFTAIAKPLQDICAAILLPKAMQRIQLKKIGKPISLEISDLNALGEASNGLWLDDNAPEHELSRRFQNLANITLTIRELLDLLDECEY